MHARTREDGFTILEMIVALTIAAVMVGGIYQLVIGQSRLFMRQQEVRDVRTSLRAAGSLLAFELRQVAPSFGDLYGIWSDSFAVRSLQATGVVCGKHESQPRVGLAHLEGDLQATPDDSALIYIAGRLWVVGSVERVWETDAGLPTCEWSGWTPEVVVELATVGTPPDVVEGEIDITARGEVIPGVTVGFTASTPELTCGEFDSQATVTVKSTDMQSVALTDCTFSVTIPNDAESVTIEVALTQADYAQLRDDRVGSSRWERIDVNAGTHIVDQLRIGVPIRAFRPVQYGVFQEDGRWWLGRRIGSGPYEKLTGPLRAPADSGLALLYYDEAGNLTSDPTRVELVEILLRGESLKGVHGSAGEAPLPVQDTIRWRVAVRG